MAQLVQDFKLSYPVRTRININQESSVSAKMFELPGAKRVCREDIKSPQSSRSPSPGDDDLSGTRAVDALQRVYSSFDTFAAPVDTSNTNTAADYEGEPGADDGAAEQEFEFRLFHTHAEHPGGATEHGEKPSSTEQRESQNGDIGVQKLKIRLRSPSPTAAGEGGFVVPFRGWGYYLSDPEMVMRVLKGCYHDGGVGEDRAAGGVDGSRARPRFSEAAVSGEEVVTRAKSTKWPGCDLPWRVIHTTQNNATATKPISQDRRLNSTTLQGSVSGHLARNTRKKKSKPGKKRRIVLRQRIASKVSAEEADKEKRNRRNREKKIKRRQKERDRKDAVRDAAALEDDGGNQDENMSS